MSQILFVVTSCDIEDYNWHGVFSSEEKAQDYIDHKKPDKYKTYDIEIITLDSVSER